MPYARFGNALLSALKTPEITARRLADAVPRTVQRVGDMRYPP